MKPKFNKGDEVYIRKSKKVVKDVFFDSINNRYFYEIDEEFIPESSVRLYIDKEREEVM